MFFLIVQYSISNVETIAIKINLNLKTGPFGEIPTLTVTLRPTPYLKHNFHLISPPFKNPHRIPHKPTRITVLIPIPCPYARQVGSCSAGAVTCHSSAVGWRVTGDGYTGRPDGSLVSPIIPANNCRTFLVAASLVWNSLPSDIQASSSLSAFRQRLKTFLFRQSFPDIVLWSHYPIRNYAIVLLF